MLNKEKRKKHLHEEIAWITQLIKEWRAMQDPELEWAIYVLEYSLERCRDELKMLSNSEGT